MWQGLKTICSSGNNSSAEVRADPLLAEELNTFVKDFTPFTLFNLALWLKLYFSFRESLRFDIDDQLILIKTSNLYLI